MVRGAQNCLPHLLKNKQGTSGIFALIFTSLISHYVDLRIIIETVISEPGQETPKMSVLSGCIRKGIKQANHLRTRFSFPPTTTRRAG